MKPNAKQKLSFAIADVVNASVRQLPSVAGSGRPTPACKTNPNASPDAAARASGGSMTPLFGAASAQLSAARTAGAVSASERQFAPVDASGRDVRVDKTNPPPPLPPLLSARQLAAARLLAAGVTPIDVARQLRMSRTGLFKWRRQPAFQAEVRHVHEWMAYAAGAAAGHAARAGRTAVR